MLVDLHVHTSFSKGTKIFHEGMNTPEEMVKKAKELGIGALAITDHDTIKGVKEAQRAGNKYGIVIIPGEEVTTRNGHILALGIKKQIPKDIGYKETVDAIHKQGGIAIASHPFDAAGKGLRKLSMYCDGVEAFNSLNLERIGNRKCEKFAKKNKLPMVAGSDAHRIDMLGHGLTRVNAKNVSGILQKIKKGQTSLVCRYTPIKTIVNWTVIRLKMSYAYTLGYMEGNYSWPKKSVGKKMIRLVNKSPGKIDYLFDLLGYVALGVIVIYRALREITGV